MADRSALDRIVVQLTEADEASAAAMSQKTDPAILTVLTDVRQRGIGGLRRMKRLALLAQRSDLEAAITKLQAELAAVNTEIGSLP